MIDFPVHYTRHCIVRPRGVLVGPAQPYVPRNEVRTKDAYLTIESRKASRKEVSGVEYRTAKGWGWVPSTTKGFRLREGANVVVKQSRTKTNGGFMVRTDCRKCGATQTTPIAVQSYRAARKDSCMDCYRKQHKFGDNLKHARRAPTAENW